MKHFTTPQFWKHFEQLPKPVRELAFKNFELLKADPKHPSLHFKRIESLWSVRIGRQHRALGIDKPEGVLWFWIGQHDEYERFLK